MNIYFIPFLTSKYLVISIQKNPTTINNISPKSNALYILPSSFSPIKEKTKSKLQATSQKALQPSNPNQSFILLCAYFCNQCMQ